jgi:SAM-dependent methyltransferase
VSTGSERRGRGAEALPSGAALWQWVEFGSYGADLAVWDELADAGGGPVLEIGAGSGRVALHLARRGLDVIAVEREPELASEIADRAAEEELPVRVLAIDALALGSERLPPLPLAIAPMHVLHELDEPGRRQLLAAVAPALQRGGRLALVLIDEAELADLGTSGAPPVPDMREVGEWLFSSEPLWVQLSADTITVRRIRQRVGPHGELDREVHDDVLFRFSAAEVEAVGAEVGLAAAERRTIDNGPGEADSILLVLERR